MAKANVVVGLDVGTSKSAIAVGAINEGGTIDLVGFGLSPNSGIRRGQVVDIEECVSSISGALEEAERTSGTPLTEAIVSVSGPHIQILESKGVVAVARADGDITSTDVERAIDAARAVAVPRNQEVLHVIPREFIVDGQSSIKDPTGMNGVRLEASVLIVTAPPMLMKTLARVTSQAGIEPIGFIFAPIASAKTLLTKKQKEMGVMLLDIGAGLTQLAVYEEGELVHAGVIPIGSMHITNDIAIGLRTNLDLAEKVKLELAQASSEGIAETAMARLEELDPAEDHKVPKKYIAEIVEARLREMFSLIKKELKSIGKDGMLPAGVVMTGGGSQLNGLIDFAKEELHLPVVIGGATVEVGGMVDKLDNPRYMEALGLMLINLENRTEAKPIRMPRLPMAGNVSGLVDKIREFFKQFLP